MSNLSTAKEKLFIQQFKVGQIVKVINKKPGLYANLGALGYVTRVNDTNLDIVWIRNKDIPENQSDGSFYTSQFEPFGTLDAKLIKLNP